MNIFMLGKAVGSKISDGQIWLKRIDLAIAFNRSTSGLGDLLAFDQHNENPFDLKLFSKETVTWITKILVDNPYPNCELEYLGGLLLRRQYGMVCISDAHSQSFSYFGKARKWNARSPEQWLMQRKPELNELCKHLYGDWQADNHVVKHPVDTKHGLKTLMLVPKELAVDYLLWLHPEMAIKLYRQVVGV